jgi:nitrogen fixation/metabolism regulation signal transduction histidine kinase
VYLLLVHASLAALAVFLLLQNRLWLIVVEVVFALSLAGGVWFMRQWVRAASVAREGAQLLADRDFTTRFRETGQPDADGMIRVYNAMVDHLREERTRLQEQQFFLSRIMRVSPSGIVTLDFDGRIDFMNPSAERLLQIASGDGKGRRIEELDSPIAQVLAALAAGQSEVASLAAGRRVKCLRGEFVDRGFPRAFLLMEELTEELRRFEKAAYEKVIRMMSHEVNNSVGASNSLLTSCLTYAPLLPPEERADFEGALKVAIGRTDELNRFMRSFADVVRLPPPVKRPCHLREMVEQLAQLLRAATDERRICWKWEFDGDPGEIAMDRGQMEQVFVNVFKNAIDAIGSDGAITVRFASDASGASVAVEDSGAGIPPDVRANLFTPFFSTKDHGQGIGLTIVREILDHHEFDYSLESAPGRPTRFTIVFR